jgi:hypothetical protein
MKGKKVSYTKVTITAGVAIDTTLLHALKADTAPIYDAVMHAYWSSHNRESDARAEYEKAAGAVSAMNALLDTMQEYDNPTYDALYHARDDVYRYMRVLRGRLRGIEYTRRVSAVSRHDAYNRYFALMSALDAAIYCAGRYNAVVAHVEYARAADIAAAWRDASHTLDRLHAIICMYKSTYDTMKGELQCK